DPMSKDGLWQIAHITDIKLASPGLTTLTGAASGAPAPIQTQANNGDLSSAATADAAAAAAAAAAQSAGTNSTGTTSGTGVQTTQGTSSGNGPADTNGASGNGAGPVLGGGPMLGVISKSKAEGIHSFNDKSHYNEWYFIYDPSQDKGQQLTGPYNPNLTLGGTTNVTGTSGGQTTSTPASPNPTAPASTAPGSSTQATPTP